jgi:inner membrane protein
MDPVSHAALGASCGQSIARGGAVVTAGLAAAGAAMAPDLDALIQSSADPLLFLEYHRQFTHALVFVPLGALLCAAVLHRFTRAHLTFTQTYGACVLGYLSHPLLDACTTYGTQLLWPFADTRVAWNVIAVFDPMFTLPVVVLVVLAALKRRTSFARIAAGWAVGYIALGGVQHLRAADAARGLAASRGHEAARLFVTPALGSLLLWKTIYEHDGRYYVDAARTGLRTTAIAGESTEKLELPRHFPWLVPGTQQAIDVQRFRDVAADYLSIDDDAPNRIVELRYSLVPNEIEGFWALVLDSSATPTDHAELVTTRENAPEQALRLLGMLF